MATHNTVTGKGRRRPGRPALGSPGDPSVALSVRLSSAHYDAACAQASAARLPLSTWARRILRSATKGGDRDY